MQSVTYSSTHFCNTEIFYEDKFYKGQENGRIIFGDIRFFIDGFDTFSDKNRHVDWKKYQ